MAVAFIATSTATGTGTTALTITPATATETAGCVVILCTCVRSSAGTAIVGSVAGDGGVWTQIGAKANVTPTCVTQMWASPPLTSIAPITCTILGTSTETVAVMAAYSGVVNIAPLYAVADPASTTAATISLTLANANSFVVAGFGGADSDGITETVAGNLRADVATGTTTSGVFATLNDNTAASGSVTNAFTLSTACAWSAVAVELTAIPNPGINFILGSNATGTGSGTLSVLSPALDETATVILATAVRSTAGTASISSVSGSGGTWVQIASKANVTPTLITQLWLGLGLTSAGTITCTVSGTSTETAAAMHAYSGVAALSIRSTLSDPAATKTMTTSFTTSLPKSWVVAGFGIAEGSTEGFLPLSTANANRTSITTGTTSSGIGVMLGDNYAATPAATVVSATAQVSAAWSSIIVELFAIPPPDAWDACFPDVQPGRMLPCSPEFPSIAYVPAINRWGIDVGGLPEAPAFDAVAGNSGSAFNRGTSLPCTVNMVAGETGFALITTTIAPSGGISGGGNWTKIASVTDPGGYIYELWTTGPGGAVAATTVTAQGVGSGGDETAFLVWQYTGIGSIQTANSVTGEGTGVDNSIVSLSLLTTIVNSIVVAGFGTGFVDNGLQAVTSGNLRATNTIGSAAAVDSNPSPVPSVLTTLGMSLSSAYTETDWGIIAVECGPVVPAPPPYSQGAVWYPSYPSIALPPQPLVPQGIIAYVAGAVIPVPVVTPLSWAPEFADFAHSRLANVEYPQPFYVPAISQWGLDLWWKPLIADFAPCPLPQVPTGIVSYVPAIKNWGTSLEAWKPTYTDIALALPEPVRVGIIAHVNVSALTPPTPPLSWSPEFADFAHGLPRPVDTGMVAYTPAINQWGLDLWWQPLIADFAPGLPRPVDTGIVAYTPAVKNWGTSLEAWKPLYDDFARSPSRPVDTGFIAYVNENISQRQWWHPIIADFAPGLPRPVDTGMVAYTPAINQWGLDLWWQPLIADFAPGLPRPVDTGIVAYTPAISNWGTGLDAWRPVYPDRIDVLRLVQEGTFSFVNSSSLAPIVPSLSWSPTFADFARGLPSNVEYPQPFYVPAIGSWGTGLDAWHAVYGDFAFGLHQVDPGISAFVYLPPVVVSATFWHPVYDDFARAAPRPVDTGMVAYTPAISNWGTGLDAWSPSYPDFARGFPAIVQEGCSIQVTQFADISPREHWYPIYADFAPAPRRPVDTGGVFYTPAISRWGLGLWWKPLIADFAPASPRPVDTGIVAYTPAVKNWGTGLDAWHPVHADLLPGRLLPRSVEFPQPFFINTSISQRLWWHPVYPDFVTPAKTIVDYGSSVFVYRSGISYFVGLSETDTISESLSVMAAFNPDLDETLGLSESINEGGANLFETVPWSEAIAVSLGHTVPLTDGIPASDWLDTLQAGIRRVIVLTDSEAKQIDHIMHELTLGRWDYDGFAVKIGERLQVTDQILPIIDVLQIPENAEYLEPASSVTPTQASAAIKMSVLLVGSVVNALVTLPDGVTPDATKVFVARNIGGGNSAKIVPVDLEPGLTSIVLSAEFDSVTLDWEGTYWIVTSLTGSAVAS